MEQDKLRKFYSDVGQNLEKVKLLELVGIIGFAGLSAVSFIMTNYLAAKGQYFASFSSGLWSVYSGFRTRSIYRRAVKDIGKN